MHAVNLSTEKCFIRFKICLFVFEFSSLSLYSSRITNINSQTKIRLTAMRKLKISPYLNSKSRLKQFKKVYFY